MKIEFLPAEAPIDTWNILYMPACGGKYNGKLTITNQRLVYDTPFDPDARDVLPGSIYTKWEKEGYVEIFKKDIQELHVEKTVMVKKATITLVDGSIHTFNYGVLNIDKVVEAIEQDTLNMHMPASHADGASSS